MAASTISRQHDTSSPDPSAPAPSVNPAEGHSLRVESMILGAETEELPASLRASLSDAGADAELVTEPSGDALLMWLACDAEAAVCALRELNPGGALRQILVVGPRASFENGATWRLIEAGAADVLTWDECDDTAAQAVVARLQRWLAVEQLLRSELVAQRLIGRSTAWIGALRQVAEAGAFTTSSVLLTGESGVGKEAAATLIHELDGRANKGRLITLDCTTVVPALSGSEFFGHERGAFTGADTARDGAFALAHGGTLFLDEVGELPLGLQAQLLRAIQERTFKRVGANTWQRTDFRLVCATNRDLQAEVAAGRFRRDLYHRVAACCVHLPALRERASDILLLSRHFLSEVLPEGHAIALDPSVREFLLRREYPGNVRDLKQLVTRIGRRHVGPGMITIGSVPIEELKKSKLIHADAALDEAVSRALALGMNLRELGRAASRAAIRLALRDEDGNLQRAARRLGVTDRALQMRRAQASGAASRAALQRDAAESFTD